MATGETVKLNRCLPLFVSLKIYWWPGLGVTCLLMHESCDRLQPTTASQSRIWPTCMSLRFCLSSFHVLVWLVRLIFYIFIHMYWDSVIHSLTLYISPWDGKKNVAADFILFSLPLAHSHSAWPLSLNTFSASISIIVTLTKLHLVLRFYIIHPSSCIMIADCCVCSTELKRYL